MGMSNNYKERFINDYVKQASTLLDITDENTIEKIRELARNRLIETNLNIFNSDKYTDRMIDSMEFWYSRGDYILNENGVLIDTTKRNEAVTSSLVSQDIELRQVSKRAKKKAAEVNDTIAERKYSTFEQLIKLRINGFYGLSGYIGGSFFNIDISDTCTTAGRTIIAVSALTIESLYGWFHFYEFGAHMKLIDRVSNENCDDICSRFTLPNVSTEDIIKHMLGDKYYNEGYYRISSLRHRIDKMTENQRKVLYVKNNVLEFYKIPEVKELLRRIILNMKDDNMCIQLDNGAILMSPFVYGPIKDDVKILQDWVQELAFGFCYYEGDYVDREYQPTMVDIVTSMKRRKIGNMDTDSAVSTMFHDKLQLIDMFKEEMGDKVNEYIFTEGALPMLLMTVYLAAVKKALREYATSINIDNDLIDMIDLECEICMEQEHLSISKKNYAFITVVKDFILKLGKMDSRGFKFKKSDANSSVAEQVESDIYNMIMCKVNQLNYQELIEHIHKITFETAQMIKTDDFIINKKSLVKVNDLDDISYGDTRMKASRLWDRLYPDLPIELPGVFGIIRIAIDEDMVEDYKRHKPEVYNKLVEHCRDLWEYGLQNKVIGKVAKILDDDDEDNIKLVMMIKTECNDKEKAVLRQICGIVGTNNYNERERNPDLFGKIMTQLHKNGLTEAEVKKVKKVLGIPMKDFEPDKEIVSMIDRIGVPVDIAVVPELFKENDYKLLDIEASSEYEHLLSPLLNTTSLTVIKNKSKNAVLTSVLQVF